MESTTEQNSNTSQMSSLTSSPSASTREYDYILIGESYQVKRCDGTWNAAEIIQKRVPPDQEPEYYVHYEGREFPAYRTETGATCL